MTLLLIGQIDGQEITASAVLAQRVRPPPRRPSPPRRMPPPPPMWRRSPPRMRRRYIDRFSISNCVHRHLIFTPLPFFGSDCYVSLFFLPTRVYIFFFCDLVGPAPRGGGPQHAAALAPDLLVAGATALVPALTPPDRRVCCLLIPSDLLDSLTPDQLEFLISQTSWTRQK